MSIGVWMATAGELLCFMQELQDDRDTIAY